MIGRRLCKVFRRTSRALLCTWINKQTTDMHDVAFTPALVTRYWNILTISSHERSMISRWRAKVVLPHADIGVASETTLTEKTN